MTIQRLLKLDLPVGQSAFLWGARKTGKSTYLVNHFPSSIYYDLLKTDEMIRLAAAPYILRQEIISAPKEALQFPVIIDEIQKIPLLLNEVHWLIENQKVGFILCGSSARKLRRGAANLLGGRAWRFNFYPLVYKEIKDFNLLQALNRGLLPSHYLSEHYVKMLRAYVSDYIAEEIQAEGLVRNLPKFARFMDLVGFTHGEPLNYANIARDCAVDAKTVKEYYQILVDTLIAYFVFPFYKRAKRDLIQTVPKFYLFDIGVANYLARKQVEVLKGDIAGKAFEHFILMEIIAYIGLHELDMPVNYWRSKSGLEVDFILNDGKVAIEVKISASPDSSELKGLQAFCSDYQPKHALVVCLAARKRALTKINNTTIEIIPWQEFLENLWGNKYFT